MNSSAISLALNGSKNGSINRNVLGGVKSSRMVGDFNGTTSRKMGNFSHSGVGGGGHKIPSNGYDTSGLLLVKPC